MRVPAISFNSVLFSENTDNPRSPSLKNLDFYDKIKLSGFISLWTALFKWKFKTFSNIYTMYIEISLLDNY